MFVCACACACICMCRVCVCVHASICLSVCMHVCFCVHMHVCGGRGLSACVTTVFGYISYCAFIPFKQFILVETFDLFVLRICTNNLVMMS